MICTVCEYEARCRYCYKQETQQGAWFFNPGAAINGQEAWVCMKSETPFWKEDRDVWTWYDSAKKATRKFLYNTISLLIVDDRLSHYLVSDWMFQHWYDMF